MMHKPRLDPLRVAPEAIKAMMGLQSYVNSCGLESSLLELVKLRASQINGCALCLAMHARDAREKGEHQGRLDLLPAWREAPDVFTGRERAALAWTEAVTLIANGGVSDQLYEEARQYFSEKELVDLTLAVIAINGWNRGNVAFRRPPEVSARLKAA